MRGVVTLPGGARMTLRGYLPDKTCVDCRRKYPAPMFIASIKLRRGVREAKFSDLCSICEPSRLFPSDLKGLRLTQTFIDDNGRVVGWFERGVGASAHEQRLDAMQFRLVDGVLRPQPKRVRVAKDKQRPITDAPVPLVRDSRRHFSPAQIARAVVRQGNRCFGCGGEFSATNPPTGDHHRPHSRGGATTDDNCRAYHVRCNSSKGDMTFDEWQERLARLQPLFRDLHP